MNQPATRVSRRTSGDPLSGTFAYRCPLLTGVSHRLRARRGGDDRPDLGGGAAQDGPAARLVPGCCRPARAVTAGRSGLCPHGHAFPGPDRAAGAAGSEWGRGHAGRLCAAHPQQAADRPVFDRRARTARPRRRTAPSGQGAAGAGGAAGPSVGPGWPQDACHRHPRRAGCAAAVHRRAARRTRPAGATAGRMPAGPLAGAAAGHPARPRGRAGLPAGPRRPPGRRRAGGRAGRDLAAAGAGRGQGAAGAGRPCPAHHQRPG